MDVIKSTHGKHIITFTYNDGFMYTHQKIVCVQNIVVINVAQF